jgi:hypothetical protein
MRAQLRLSSKNGEVEHAISGESGHLSCLIMLRPKQLDGGVRTQVALTGELDGSKVREKWELGSEACEVEIRIDEGSGGTA